MFGSVCHCRSSQAESSTLELNVFPHVWSPGDEILDVNGIPIKGLTFQEAIHTFKVTVSPWVSFVLFLFFPSSPMGFAIWQFPTRLLVLQQIRSGLFVLTVRTKLLSPSLTPCSTPTHMSRSSSPSFNSSGGPPAGGGSEEGGSSSLGRKAPGPKDRIVMEVTLNKGTVAAPSSLAFSSIAIWDLLLLSSLNQVFGTACCQVSKWPGSSQGEMLNRFTKGRWNCWPQSLKFSPDEWLTVCQGLVLKWVVQPSKIVKKNKNKSTPVTPSPRFSADPNAFSHFSPPWLGLTVEGESAITNNQEISWRSKKSKRFHIQA